MALFAIVFRQSIRPEFQYALYVLEPLPSVVQAWAKLGDLATEFRDGVAKDHWTLSKEIGDSTQLAGMSKRGVIHDRMAGCGAFSGTSLHVGLGFTNSPKSHPRLEKLVETAETLTS